MYSYKYLYFMEEDVFLHLEQDIWENTQKLYIVAL